MRLRNALLAAALLACANAGAQDGKDAQRKLDQVRRELKDVAADRRRIEGQRGDAVRELRRLDETVGASMRTLQGTQARLQQQQQRLAELQRQRDALRAGLVTQRAALAQLLRAAYVVGEDAPLKVMLAQDRVADANRVLAYHGYLQRDRARRIAALQAELAGLEHIEREISGVQAGLDAQRVRQQADMARLAQDRRDRQAAMTRLDAQYNDRKAREQALGRDAKGLERVLSQLRAAARRAEAERQAAARRAAQTPAGTRTARPKPPVIANATPIRVGGLGWPLSGSLVTRYGGTLPDGRRSAGILIGAPAGTSVRAVANGKVVFAEWMSGYGLICIVDHGDGTMSLYANNDSLLRDAGADVKRGDPVASVGNSGGQGMAALYFELRRNGQPVDPAAWLQKR